MLNNILILSLLLLLPAAAEPGGHLQPTRPLPAPLEGVDQFGKNQNFKSLTGKQGLILVVFRSADW